MVISTQCRAIEAFTGSRIRPIFIAFTPSIGFSQPRQAAFNAPLTSH